MQMAAKRKTLLARVTMTLAMLPGLVVLVPARAAVLAAPGDEVRHTYQTPSEQYLALRRMYPPQRGLTLDILGQNPALYQGMTLEISGRLSGIVRLGDEGALLMLATPKHGAVTLQMSQLPSWVQPGTQLRALVVATGDQTPGTVLGIPDMQVVAVASASDIRAAEVRWQKTETAKREAREARQGVPPAPVRPGPLVSRSSRPAGRVARGGSAVSAATTTTGPVPAGLSPRARNVFPAYRAFIARHNPRLSARQADDITATLLGFSDRMDVDPRLVVAVIIAESNFDPGATSRVGAMGLGQIMPGTARDIGLTNPYDPVQNVAGAVYLLKQRLDKYSGGLPSDQLSMQHIILALAAYNAGMGAVKKHGGVPPYRETRNYVKKVERIYRSLCPEKYGSGAAS